MAVTDGTLSNCMAAIWGGCIKCALLNVHRACWVYPLPSFLRTQMDELLEQENEEDGESDEDDEDDDRSPSTTSRSTAGTHGQASASSQAAEQQLAGLSIINGGSGRSRTLTDSDVTAVNGSQGSTSAAAAATTSSSSSSSSRQASSSPGVTHDNSRRSAQGVGRDGGVVAAGNGSSSRGIGSGNGAVAATQAAPAAAAAVGMAEVVDLDFDSGPLSSVEREVLVGCVRLMGVCMEGLKLVTRKLLAGERVND